MLQGIFCGRGIKATDRSQFGKSLKIPFPGEKTERNGDIEVINQKNDC